MNKTEEILFRSFVSGPIPCKYCGKICKSLSGDYPLYIWCCKQAEEDVEQKLDKEQISRLGSRGYKVVDKKETELERSSYIFESVEHEYMDD